MAAPAATLNATLKTVLDAQFNNREAIAEVADNTVAIAAPRGNTARSIHVPSYTTAAGYTEDSRITITTLLNQWDVYTKDHNTPVGAPVAATAGILTGLNVDGTAAAADAGLNAYLFAFIFGGRQQALDALTAIVADSTAAGAAGAARTFNYDFAPEITKLTDVNPASWAAAIAPANAANAPAGLHDWTTGWSGLLNGIAAYFPDDRKRCGAGEMYAPPANQNTAPALDPANPVGPDAIAPANLIRYAFGLLYKIKVVLGTQWPETHRQLSMGGGKKKSSRYTHRRKQYSQRRYKK